jgi:hypothetical protein
MKKSLVRHAVQYLSVSWVCIGLGSSFAEAAGRPTKCAALFFSASGDIINVQPPKKKPSERSRAETAKAHATATAIAVDPRSAIVVRNEEPSSDRRDVTLLGGQAAAGQATPAIPDSHIKRTRLTKTSEGDFIEIELYAQGSPYQPAGAATAAISNGQKAGPLIGHSGRHSGSLVRGDSGRAVVAGSKTNAVVSESESRRLVRELIVERDAPDARLDDAQINMMVNLLHRDPETLERALRYASEKKERGVDFLTNAAVLVLSNVGSNRYFKFRPISSGPEVEARVHDINRKKNPEVVNILVEWLEPAIGDEPRIRRISSLTVDQLATVQLPSEAGRREIAVRFEDLLSINEVKTRRFANSLGLKTFGITQYDPHGHQFETRGGRVNMILDPYTAITGNSPSMSRERFESVFGSVVDLFTPTEVHDQRVNMFDVTSRLNPGFVLKRISAERSHAKFAFVINEDGQLKVAAHLPENSYQEPDFLRLGHGRRIFVKGIFELDRDGSVRVLSTRNSRSVIGYGEDPTRDDSASLRLIAAAFAAQAGRRVTEVDGRFQQGDPLAGFSNVSSQKGQWASTDFYDSAWSAFTGRPGSYVPPISDRGAPMATGPSAHLAWDSAGNAKPLSYEAWQTEMRKVLGRELNGYTEAESRIGWSHYVLKSNPNMSKDAIRKNYRKLASRFHGDTHGNKIDDRDDIQNVNGAWQTIEAAFTAGAQP